MRLDETTTVQPIRQEHRRASAVFAVLIVAAAVFFSLPAPPHPAPKPQAARPRLIMETASVATVYDALTKCGPSLSEGERSRIAGAVRQESVKYGYDPLFVAAMIEVESGCKPSARGIAGAVGLIQIRPTTAKAVAAESGLPWRGDATLRDGAQNIRLGVRYLWSLEERFSDPHLAIAAYNLGPTRVAQMSRQRARNAQYVRRVLGRYQDLVEQYS